MKKTIYFLIIILLSAFIADTFFSDSAGADDGIYSSNFEYSMMRWEDDIVLESNENTINYEMLGDNSPSARYNAAKERMKYRQTIDYLYRRHKHEYRPYSRSVHQKRREYDPRDTNWQNPWYR